MIVAIVRPPLRRLIQDTHLPQHCSTEPPARRGANAMPGNGSWRPDRKPLCVKEFHRLFRRRVRRPSGRCGLMGDSWPWPSSRRAGRAGDRVVPLLPSRAPGARCGPPGTGLQAGEDGVADLPLQRAQGFFRRLALGQLLVVVRAALAAGVADLSDRGHVDGVAVPPVPAPGQPAGLARAGGHLDRRSRTRAPSFGCTSSTRSPAPSSCRASR